MMDQLSAFSPAQVGDLTSKQLAALTPAALQSLDATADGRAPRHLDERRRGSPSSAELAALTSTQIRSFSTLRSTVRRPTVDGSTAGQFAGLTAAQIAGLSTTVLNSLSADQVGALSTTQARGLTSTNWPLSHRMWRSR